MSRIPCLSAATGTRDGGNDAVNLAGLDMNLVVALRALLAERNVTRAGQRVGLSQPAMSAALARLRRHFGDELLVRKGTGYELTALGAVLLDRTAVACEMLERVFGSQPRFDPAREEREFVILASDYAVAGLRRRAGPRDQRAGAAGPAHLPSGVRRVTEIPPAQLSTVDGLLMPHGSSPACPPSTCSATAGCAWWPRTTRRSANPSRWASSPSCPGPPTSASTTPP